jgi:DNA phosphorothioation-dependent restriction protein DptF
VDGYRPNKHDKNTVVILDEIVDKIADVANSSDTLYILKKDQRIKITSDGEDFEVSGL